MKSLPALLLAALSLAVAAPSANATIVIGQSVAGVQLSATRAQVNRKLGPPVSHIGPELLYPESVGLRVRFKHGRVVKILSYLQRQQTSGGITIGSRRAQLARFYPHAKCQEGHSPAYLYCVVAAHLHGRASYTGFLFEAADAGVVEIELGYGSVAQALKHP